MDAAEQKFEALRAREFSRLDRTGQAYLDYTGSGLYAESHVRAHAQELAGAVLGNPHSESPTSLASTQRVEAARARILAFFDADPEEYDVCFAGNASGALKLVGESYPFEAGSRFVLSADSHNSVNGIRQFAEAHGATVDYLPLDQELRPVPVEHVLPDAGAASSLFAFPAQSNFSGVKHPLDAVRAAHERGYDVLLDAAAFVPSNRLSLHEVRPEFVVVSFYKMFGFPTGVGALIGRRRALVRLRRPWFAGGTVRFASAQNRLHLLKDTGEAFEDGTLNFLGIAALAGGFDLLESVGMEAIQRHVMRLTGRALEALGALRHSNGAPMIRLYGPADTRGRGGTIAFNVLDATGASVAYQLVEQRAADAGVSVRTGCFCNPGAAEYALGFAREDSSRCFRTIAPEEFDLERFSSCMNEAAVGAVRASFGIASNGSDLDRFLDVIRGLRDYVAHGLERKRAPAPVGG